MEENTTMTEVAPEAPKAEKVKKAAKAKAAKPKADKAKAAKPKADKAKADKKPAKDKPLSLIDAAYKALKMTSNAKGMNCKEMVESAKAKKFWKPGAGLTPHATLSSAILREINTKGKKSRFKKVSPGHYVAVKQPAA